MRIKGVKNTSGENREASAIEPGRREDNTGG